MLERPFACMSKFALEIKGLQITASKDAEELA